jgi:hypothetical protein
MLFSKSVYRATRSRTQSVIIAAVLLLFTAFQASARSGVPDLTDSVWKWEEEQTSFVLTFKQVKPEANGVVAILNGWGNDPLEVRGEYSENAPEPRLHLTGSYEGDTIIFDLAFNPGDQEQQPFLSGEFSVGSKVFTVSAGCGKQCPDVVSKMSGEPETASAASTGTELIGEWQDDSEAIGFKEYWSVKSVNGQWEISGRFVKGKEVVGSFHADEVSFDAKKGVLYFRQVFDQKPVEQWLDSNDIEVTAQSDTLKFKVRGVEAILTRTPGSKK